MNEIIQQIHSDPERPDSPVGDYLEREFVQFSRHANIDIARNLSSLYTELRGIAIELTREQLNPTVNSLTDHSCLSLLLESHYIDPGVETLAVGYELRGLLREILVRGDAKKLLAISK